MTVARLRRLFILAVVPLLACNGGTEPPGPPTQLAKVSGDLQQGSFSTPLPLPYSVEVTDAKGRDVPGVEVTWTIVLGGGSLSGNSDTTDQLGIASTVHTLGTASTYVVRATVFGLPSVTFSASASATLAPDTFTSRARDIRVPGWSTSR
jgi:Big-like domain-containing protein